MGSGLDEFHPLLHESYRWHIIMPFLTHEFSGMHVFKFLIGGNKRGKRHILNFLRKSFNGDPCKSLFSVFVCFFLDINKFYLSAHFISLKGNIMSVFDDYSNLNIKRWPGTYSSSVYTFLIPIVVMRKVYVFAAHGRCRPSVVFTINNLFLLGH